MTTKTNTTRRPSATDKAVAGKQAAKSLATVVTAYKAAAGNTSGVEGQMLSLDEQRRVLRVWQARAAVAVFTHPEVGSKYATAATAVGESRTTFRRFVDGGLKLKNPLSTDAPTAHEIKQVNAGWDKVAVEQKDRDSKPKDDKDTKVSKVGQSEGDTEGGEPDTTPPVWADVTRSLAALAANLKAVKSVAPLTPAQLKALESSMRVILNDAKK